MDYNLIMYIGVGLIVGGFGLFLYSEMKIREIDRKMAENQRFIDAMMRVKKWVIIIGVMDQSAMNIKQSTECEVLKAQRFWGPERLQ